MTKDSTHLNKPVINFMRKDVAKLLHHITVQQALDNIRQRGIGDRIVYFYAVDDDDRLVGVVPTRRLLSAPIDRRISEVMITHVIMIPEHATVFETYEYCPRDLQKK
jgi:magnesium transporter